MRFDSNACWGALQCCVRCSLCGTCAALTLVTASLTLCGTFDCLVHCILLHEAANQRNWPSHCAHMDLVCMSCVCTTAALKTSRCFLVQASAAAAATGTSSAASAAATANKAANEAASAA